MKKLTYKDFTKIQTTKEDYYFRCFVGKYTVTLDPYEGGYLVTVWEDAEPVEPTTQTNLPHYTDVHFRAIKPAIEIANNLLEGIEEL